MLKPETTAPAFKASTEAATTRKNKETSNVVT